MDLAAYYVWVAESKRSGKIEGHGDLGEKSISGARKRLDVSNIAVIDGKLSI